MPASASTRIRPVFAPDTCTYFPLSTCISPAVEAGTLTTRSETPCRAFPAFMVSVLTSVWVLRTYSTILSSAPVSTVEEGFAAVNDTALNALRVIFVFKISAIAYFILSWF